MMNIVISSGHGKYIRGASGYIDEVDEARRVVEQVASYLRTVGAGVKTFHDNISNDQSENLNRIVDYHNTQTRDLDVSVHFNAYQTTSNPMGTECLYVTQAALAGDTSRAIASAGGFIDRGPKKRTDLFFLNNTEEPAILIEVCFVDSSADANLYRQHFNAICAAIAETISGQQIARPPEAELPPTEPPATGERPTIRLGSTGPHVADLQRILGLLVDGDFGSITDAQVRSFQAASDLDDDGIVGPLTWDAVDTLARKLKDGSDGISKANKLEIVNVALNSDIFDYSWPDRGHPPAGYIPGMALAFASCVQLLEAGDTGVEFMAQRENGDDDDALAYYHDEFIAHGMSNAKDGIDTLRHLFVFLIGLGMRESSGRYCEGRDMSAENVSSDTAEAGLFQTSWNINTASDHIPLLLDRYWDDPNGFLNEFNNGVTPTSDNFQHYGSGEGARYQFLAKFAPTFAVMTTAVGLRCRKDHWGPVIRYEVDIRSDADAMLREVQSIVLPGV